MKGLAHMHVWWPGVDSDIEQMVHNYPDCQSVQNQPSTVTLYPRLMGSMFLVVVDAHSKWLEVIPMTTTSSGKTIEVEVLHTLFPTYCLPQKLVSDNGPQFTASSFEDFLLANGIQHLKTPPYHPATNEEADRFVQTFEHALKASRNESGTLATKLSLS